MILNLHYQDFKLIFTVFLFWISIQFGQVVGFNCLFHGAFSGNCPWGK